MYETRKDDPNQVDVPKNGNGGAFETYEKPTAFGCVIGIRDRSFMFIRRSSPVQPDSGCIHSKLSSLALTS
jgi:hypothetical protein